MAMALLDRYVFAPLSSSYAGFEANNYAQRVF